MAATIVASVGAAQLTASPSAAFTSYTPATNDVVVIFFSSGGLDAINAAPAGWTNLLGGTTTLASDAHTEVCFYHLVTSAEAAAVTTTYTITNAWTASRNGNTIGAVIRGVDTAAVIDSFNTAFDSANAATPHIMAGLTGTNLSTGSLVVSAVYSDGSNTWTTPSGWTAVASSTSTGNAPGALFSNNTATTAGTNVAATNITPSAGDEYTSITIAFSAAAASAPVLKTYNYSIVIPRAANY